MSDIDQQWLYHLQPAMVSKHIYWSIVDEQGELIVCLDYLDPKSYRWLSEVMAVDQFLLPHNWIPI